MLASSPAGRRILVAGCAGVLLTAPLSLLQPVSSRPLLSCALTLLGAGIAVACASGAWDPSRPLATAALVVCVVCSGASAYFGATNLATALRTGDTTLACADDVAVAVVRSGQLVRDGRNPYTDYNVLKADRSLGCSAYTVTPLRSGPFATFSTTPDDAQTQAAAHAAAADPSAGGVLLGINYPGGSLLLGLLGARGVIVAAILVLALAGALIVARSPAAVRRELALALGAQTGAVAVVGSVRPDLVVAALLVVACCRRATLVGGVALGLACATKQTAWFVTVPLLILAWRERPGGLARYLGAAAATFAAVNLPFIVANPAAWVQGVISPEVSPAFPTGFGPIGLVVGHAALNVLLPIFTALMVGTVFAGVMIAWRGSLRWAGAGMIVASLGLWDGPRSLGTYVAILGLLAVSTCAATAPRDGIGSLDVWKAAKVGIVGADDAQPVLQHRKRRAEHNPTH